MKKCPKCGCEEFEVACLTHDKSTYLVSISEDGTVNSNESLKDVCGETDWFGNAECSECGCNVNIQTGEQLEEGAELFPYSVILLYPPTEWPNENLPETYFEHTMALDTEDAVKNVQEKACAANNGNIPAEEFSAIAVFSGHLEIEMGASQ